MANFLISQWCPVTLPMMFASEIFYSMSAIPGWVKVIGHVLPLSYLIEGEKAALIVNMPGIVLPTLALLGFTFLTLILAVVAFRWDADVTLMQRLLRVRAA